MVLAPDIGASRRVAVGVRLPKRAGKYIDIG
jgi:hypothetical protein